MRIILIFLLHTNPDSNSYYIIIHITGNIIFIVYIFNYKLYIIQDNVIKILTKSNSPKNVIMDWGSWSSKNAIFKK